MRTYIIINPSKPGIINRIINGDSVLNSVVNYGSRHKAFSIINNPTDPIIRGAFFSLSLSLFRYYFFFFPDKNKEAPSLARGQKVKG